MTCYYPVEIPLKGCVDLRQTVACGQCLGCRIDRTRDWKIRLVHESRLHEDKCFITLTYADENIPFGGTLVKRDFQLFMKRLRKSRPAKKIRFFHCGEYGGKNDRPHYHAIIYGTDFSDKRFYKNSRDGSPLFKSAELDGLWAKGIAVIGACTPETCAYVAGYILKKITGELGELYYSHVDADGVLRPNQPPYITMSNRPGIGREHYDRYAENIYASDSVVLGGVELPPPKRYDRYHKQLEEKNLHDIKQKRIATAREPSRRKNSTPQRLAVRAEVQAARISNLKRDGTK